MDARAEQRSLNECPLPPVVILDPLTRVWEYDAQIAALQEQIAEDENYRLERKAGRILRAINPEKFREVFPQEWEMIKQIEIRDLNERIQHAGEKIPVGVADKLVKPIVLNNAPGVVTVTQSPDQYKVVRR